MKNKVIIGIRHIIPSCKLPCHKSPNVHLLGTDRVGRTVWEAAKGARKTTAVANSRRCEDTGQRLASVHLICFHLCTWLLHLWVIFFDLFMLGHNWRWPLCLASSRASGMGIQHQPTLSQSQFLGRASDAAVKWVIHLNSGKYKSWRVSHGSPSYGSHLLSWFTSSTLKGTVAIFKDSRCFSLWVETSSLIKHN